MIIALPSEDFSAFCISSPNTIPQAGCWYVGVRTGTTTHGPEVGRYAYVWGANYVP